jgi:HK97 family phage prohead protease
MEERVFGIREIKTLPLMDLNVDLDEGTFECYAAAYGNIDDGGDRFHYGSGKHIADANPTLPIFYQHDWMQGKRPLGKSLLFDERKPGLWLKAKVFDTQDGRDTLVGMREGVIGEMSIGWNCREKKITKEGGRTVREVLKYDLFECSACTNGFAMNSQAVITAVKSRLPILRATDDPVQKTRTIGGITGLVDIGGSPSWESIEDAVRTALRAGYTEGDRSIYIADISATAVVYEVYDWETGKEDLFTVEYSIDDAGVATITGEPVATVIHASYEPKGFVPAGKVNVHDGTIESKDYKELRGFVERTDPVALLLDEAAYLHTLAQELKAEGREEEVRQALIELDAAALLLKGQCAINDIPVDQDDGDLLEAIRRTTLSIREVSQELAS